MLTQKCACLNLLSTFIPSVFTWSSNQMVHFKRKLLGDWPVASNLLSLAAVSAVYIEIYIARVQYMSCTSALLTHNRRQKSASKIMKLSCFHS